MSYCTAKTIQTHTIILHNRQTSTQLLSYFGSQYAYLRYKCCEMYSLCIIYKQAYKYVQKWRYYCGQITSGMCRGFVMCNVFAAMNSYTMHTYELYILHIRTTILFGATVCFIFSLKQLIFNIIVIALDEHTAIR